MDRPAPALSFRFRIDGAPPSWNAAYRIVRVPHRGGGSHQQLAKTYEGAMYQMVATNIAKHAVPPGWEVEGQLRVRYWLRLKRPMDATNCLKLLEDAVAAGIGVDDKWFLPCVEELSWGWSDPHVEIEVAPVV